MGELISALDGQWPRLLRGMGLIDFQVVGVRLRNFAALQKQQTQFIRRHPCNESFRLVKGGS